MPGFWIFSREGVQAGPSARKQSGQLFFSPKLMLHFTEEVQWFYIRETITIQRIQRGSNIFQGGGGEGNFFQGGGGVQMLISI